MRPIALFLLLLAVEPAASAREATSAPPREVPRFVIVLLEDGEGHRIETLYTALQAAGAHVVDRSARAGLDLPLAPELYAHASLDEPRAALLAARASLRELSLKDVDQRLDEALAAALRLPSPSEHMDLLGDILLLRAEMALARGVPDEAQRDLRLLARLDERRVELHPGLFPPNVVVAYEQARSANDVAEPGYVFVAADAGGAPLRVVVDGAGVAADAARAGLEVKAGPHLVTLSARGRVGRSFLVNVAAGEPLSLSLHLFPPHADERRAEALAALRARANDDMALERLLEATGASAALIVGGDVAFTFSALRGRVPLDVEREEDPRGLARAAIVAAQPPIVSANAPSRLAAAVPAEEEEQAGALPLLVTGGVVMGVLLVAGTGIGVLVWALQPGDETIPSPPVPVVGTGFSQARR